MIWSKALRGAYCGRAACNPAKSLREAAPLDNCVEAAFPGVYPGLVSRWLQWPIELLKGRPLCYPFPFQGADETYMIAETSALRCTPMPNQRRANETFARYWLFYTVGAGWTPTFISTLPSVIS